MRCSIYVDRDLLTSFDDEASALALVREQFDDDAVLADVWLEIGDGDSAEILQGEQLLHRLRAARRRGRLSA